jgi:hypothetical protein
LILVMNLARRIGAVGAVAFAAGASIGCGLTHPDCAHPPCPLPMAVSVTATSAAGGPVADLSVKVLAPGGNGFCTVGATATTCFVPGTAGRYTLEFTAPGFEQKTVTVTVGGETPECGCSRVDTQQISVVLTPR